MMTGRFPDAAYVPQGRCLRRAVFLRFWSRARALGSRGETKLSLLFWPRLGLREPSPSYSPEGCQCGVGMPCECNRAEGYEEPDISSVISEPTIQ